MRLSDLVLITATLSLIGFSQHSYGLSLPSMDASRPSFVNISGEKIMQAEAGQPIEIVESIRNDIYNEDRSLVALVDVRDQEGVTIYLAWHSAVIGFDDTYTFGISWNVPDDAKTGAVYSARCFAITSFGDDAQPLSTVLQSDIEIT